MKAPSCLLAFLQIPAVFSRVSPVNADPRSVGPLHRENPGADFVLLLLALL
jgi:hypothetical protein